MIKYKIILKTLVALIPFYILGSILYNLFPQIPNWIAIFCHFILFISIVYVIYLKKKKLRESKDNYTLPEYLLPSTLFYLFIGATLAHFMTENDSRTQLYIDNGKSVPIEIIIPNEEKLIVPANSFKTSSIRLGTTNIVVNGKIKTINIPTKGNWIYNIDTLNMYYESTVDYSNQLFRNGKVDSSYFNKPNVKLITGEIIKSDAAYLFEAPNTITVNNTDIDKKAVAIRVLYRIPKPINTNETDLNANENNK